MWTHSPLVVGPKPENNQRTLVNSRLGQWVEYYRSGNVRHSVVRL